MRLNNYLTENNDEFIIDNIKKNCSDIIKVYKKIKKVLYRGTFTLIKNPIIPRIDRKPVDMKPEAHKMLDELFYEKFGWKVRSEGVFVTNSIHIADGYGKLYFFFPENDFKFVWNKKIVDLYSHVYNVYDDNYFKLKEIVNSYIDNELDDAVKNGKEISFKCKKYWLVEYNNIYVVKEILGFDPEVK